MGKITGRPVRAQVLRPHGHLLRQTTLSIIAFFAPVFAVLYWLTIPIGEWLPVAAAQLAVMLTALVGIIGFLRTCIWVDDTGVSERGFFGRNTSFPSEQISSVVLLELYQSGTVDSQPQLFVTGQSGELLVRMRGQFYSRGAMDIVADELGVPIVRVPDPMTLSELNRLRPELLYWFERRLTGRTRQPMPDADLSADLGS
ncbi:hypothetical protein [Cryobacterium sp. PAMC25264]|uniref:hypothetical protein n=1 Tax=Cryobacterium sp. PAMC25264 TaxID=2861288 RepID=UPI001C62CBD8|nr:hypothetical protein [Cryobacterium sp. PAMC25264]QYF73685.1 hypothetical protein KY500_18815 [Cryobacterium sp. PAMC25264]